MHGKIAQNRHMADLQSAKDLVKAVVMRYRQGMSTCSSEVDNPVIRLSKPMKTVEPRDKMNVSAIIGSYQLIKRANHLDR